MGKLAADRFQVQRMLVDKLVAYLAQVDRLVFPIVDPSTSQVVQRHYILAA